MFENARLCDVLAAPDGAGTGSNLSRRADARPCRRNKLLISIQLPCRARQTRPYIDRWPRNTPRRSRCTVRWTRGTGTQAFFAHRRQSRANQHHVVLYDRRDCAVRSTPADLRPDPTGPCSRQALQAAGPRSADQGPSRATATAGSSTGPAAARCSTRCSWQPPCWPRKS